MNLEDVYGHTPHDDAERVEAALETKVLVTLMRAAGGRAGSGASRTHMQEFRKGGLEEKRLETWSELLETRQKRLRDVRSLEMWVQEQIASVNGMRALVDESIALEREQGSVLVEKKPALFEALHDFGDAQRMQAAAAARARDMAEGWADGTEEGGRTGFGGREANTSNRRAFRRVLYSKVRLVAAQPRLAPREASRRRCVSPMPRRRASCAHTGAAPRPTRAHPSPLAPTRGPPPSAAQRARHGARRGRELGGQPVCAAAADRLQAADRAAAARRLRGGRRRRVQREARPARPRRWRLLAPACARYRRGARG